MDSSNHARLLKLITEMTKAKLITDKEKDMLKEKLLNEEPEFVKLSEICQNFTDDEIKEELKNLIRAGKPSLSLKVERMAPTEEESSPLGAALMKKKRKSKLGAEGLGFGGLLKPMD